MYSGDTGFYSGAAQLLPMLRAFGISCRAVSYTHLGTKGKWYDHTVSIRNAQPKAADAAETPADGEYLSLIHIACEGGNPRCGLL